MRSFVAAQVIAVLALTAIGLARFGPRPGELTRQELAESRGAAAQASRCTKLKCSVLSGVYDPCEYDGDICQECGKYDPTTGQHKTRTYDKLEQTPICGPGGFTSKFGYQYDCGYRATGNCEADMLGQLTCHIDISYTNEPCMNPIAVGPQ